MVISHSEIRFIIMVNYGAGHNIQGAAEKSSPLKFFAVFSANV